MYRIKKNTETGEEQVQMLEHGRWRDVSSDQDLYLEWCKNNVAEIVEFTPPPPTPVPEPRPYEYDPAILIRRLDKLDRDAEGERHLLETLKTILSFAPIKIQMLWEKSQSFREDDKDFVLMIETCRVQMALTDEDEAYLLEKSDRI